MEDASLPDDSAAVLRASVRALGASRLPQVAADARAAGVDAPVLRRLNLNESPFPPSPRAIAAIQQAAGEVNRYPDPKARALAAAIAARSGVPAERIVFGNGSDELIALCASIVLEPGTSAVLPVPSFPRYLGAIVFAGAAPLPVPVRSDGANDVAAMLAAIRPDTRVVFAASPNNPTGAMLDRGDVERLAAGVPESALLIVDEAYFEFGRHAGGPDAREVLAAARRGPWVVLRTLSKAYGLAGLRVGYALASDAMLVEAVNRIRGAFNVNALAQAAALAALEDRAHTQALLDDCARERARLAEGLRRLGCAPLPSVANFVAAETKLSAAELVQRLAQRGVLVAAIGPPPFEHHIRITIGSGEDTDAVLAALAEILGSG